MTSQRPKATNLGTATMLASDLIAIDWCLAHEKFVITFNVIVKLR